MRACHLTAWHSDTYLSTLILETFFLEARIERERTCTCLRMLRRVCLSWKVASMLLMRLACSGCLSNFGATCDLS
jgi:hypothetical protein